MNVAKEVKKVMAEQLGMHECDLKDEQTWDDLGADSIDQIEIVLALEDYFAIEFG